MEGDKVDLVHMLWDQIHLITLQPKQTYLQIIPKDILSNNQPNTHHQHLVNIHI